MTFHRTVALTGAILLAAGGGAAQSRARKTDSPDIKEIRDYRLNMDVVERFLRAVKAISDDAATRKCFDNNAPGNAPTLDAGEKITKACPAAVNDLDKAAMKPREFLIVTAALIGDVMAVSMKKTGMIKDYPPSMSTENAVFIEQNFDKLQTMLAPLNGNGK